MTRLPSISERRTQQWDMQSVAQLPSARIWPSTSFRTAGLGKVDSDHLRFQAYVNATAKEYILSVPAIWSDNARERTLECAYRAGYGMRFSPESITLIAEPEAAAAYTITTQPHRSFPAGDIFIICDAGGGTVDLSVYRVTRPMPDLELEEIAISNGDLCGSVFLDREFLAHVEKRIGRLPEDAIQGVLADFRENIKMDFTGEDEEAYQIYVGSSLPNKPALGFDNGTIVITSDEIRDIFEEVVGQVLVLLTQQMGEIAKTGYKNPVSILLVGGFGSNPYLKKRIDEQFPESDVIQPPDAWSAIIKGSLMRGAIKRRKMRCAYGIAFRNVWTRDLDSRPQRFKDDHQIFDKITKKLYCINCMEWYVKKGDEFTDRKPVSFSFFRNIGVHHTMKFEDILYVYMDGVDGDAGPKYKDTDCKPLAKLTTDLNVVPNLRDHIEKNGGLRKSQEGWYYHINYELVMVFDSQINFYLSFNGLQTSQIEIQYVEPELHVGTRKT
ncbi:actin-like ATPase domain-containing protein [Lophiostoma macrostomum CBS 122681]|uniref:Actin-like ATPase domain-containing protein n=1 Tax=Lophiostoma macrostomum CBS 122681 TaxID=1314788 RepID=A0A6A6SNE2_9PLEO|nr:actin-like ATPase domain-containing protein [Lophiostoma macrostomum CBS 122681]